MDVVINKGRNIYIEKMIKCYYFLIIIIIDLYDLIKQSATLTSISKHYTKGISVNL